MFTSTGFLPERFPYDFRMLSEYGELKKNIPKLCSEILLFLLRFTGSMPGHTMAESPILFEICGHHRHSERVRYVLGLFGVFGKNTEHTGSVRAVRKMFGKHIEIRKGYWKHSESIRHVLGAFGVFGKHTDSSAS